MLIVDITQGMGGERQLTGQLLRMTAQDGHRRVCHHVGILLSKKMTGFYQVLHTLVGVRGPLRHEQDDTTFLRKT